MAIDMQGGYDSPKIPFCQNFITQQLQVPIGELLLVVPAAHRELQGTGNVIVRQCVAPPWGQWARPCLCSRQVGDCQFVRVEKRSSVQPWHRLCRGVGLGIRTGQIITGIGTENGVVHLCRTVDVLATFKGAVADATERAMSC